VSNVCFIVPTYCFESSIGAVHHLHKAFLNYVCICMAAKKAKE